MTGSFGIPYEMLCCIQILPYSVHVTGIPVRILGCGYGGGGLENK